MISARESAQFLEALGYPRVESWSTSNRRYRGRRPGWEELYQNDVTRYKGGAQMRTEGGLLGLPWKFYPPARQQRHQVRRPW